MSQLLAFDYGLKSIGVAVGQAVTGSATPLAALAARDGQPDWQQVQQVLAEWQPQQLVVGLPLNMDGSEQDISIRARKFANRLHGRFGLPVALQDERLTTAEAKALLFAEGGYRNLQKAKIDSLSAVLILQDFFANAST